MKNAKLLSLALALLLTLTACGGQSMEPVGKVDTDTPQTEQADTAPAEAEVPDETDEAAPSFDNSWASNDFEMQLPEPTFEVWEVSQYVEGSSWRVDANRAEYDAVKAYADALRGAGFSNAVDEDDGYEGLAYIFKADNNAGYHVKLIFEADNQQGLGHAALELTRAASSTVAAAPVSGNGELPELPAAEWDYEEVETPSGIKTVALCDTLTKDDLMAYAQILKDAGFTNGLEESPDGDEAYLYSFRAENADGSQLVRLRLFENQLTEVLMWNYN